MKRVLFFIFCIIFLGAFLFSCDNESISSSETESEAPEGITQSEGDEVSVSESTSELQSGNGVKEKYDYKLSDYIFVNLSPMTIDLKMDYLQMQIDQSLYLNNPSALEFSSPEGYIVKEGDIVKVSYEGFYTDDEGNIKLDEDGNEMKFSGGSGTSVCYIGSRTFIVDFEKGLVGLEVGVPGRFKATFPKNYGVIELDGKTVVFKAIVSEVAKAPEYTAELINNYYGTSYKSTDEFETALITSYVKNALKTKLLGDCFVFKYPQLEKELLERKISQEYFDIYLKDYYSSLDAYINILLKEEMAYYAYARNFELVPSGEYDDYEEYEKELFRLVDEHILENATINKIPKTYTSVTNGGSLFD